MWEGYRLGVKGVSVSSRVSIVYQWAFLDFAVRVFC